MLPGQWTKRGMQQYLEHTARVLIETIKEMYILHLSRHLYNSELTIALCLFLLRKGNAIQRTRKDVDCYLKKGLCSTVHHEVASDTA